MSALEALEEIRDLLIRLTNDERRELQATMREGRAIPVVVGNPEAIGDADSDGPIVALHIDGDAAAKLRGDAIEEIERIVDNVLVRGAA